MQGLVLSPAEPFTWTEKTEPAHAKDYTAHTQKHVAGAYNKEEYEILDARISKNLLTIAGILGCRTACMSQTSASV